MRVLLIHRYFWPDTPPYAAMLRSIAGRLVEDGHDVSVLSSQPSYKKMVQIDRQNRLERLDGISVNRVSLMPEAGRNVFFRLINMIYFPLRVFFFLMLKKRFDVVMASTAPPVVVGFSAAIGAKLKKSAFFYHCMDIHPEIGAISGEFRNPIIFKLLQLIDVFSCNVSSEVIVLSSDMKKSLENRPGYKKNNISVINNFSMPFYDSDSLFDESLLKKAGKFRVVFAGNLGRFQGLDIFVDAMKILDGLADVELVFVGSGNALQGLKALANGMKNIVFFPHQPVSVAKKIIRDADLGIVSLNKNIYKYAYPSKTMAYLEEGCPLLVSVEGYSELSKFVDEKNIGICVSDKSPLHIAQAIEIVYKDKQKYGLMKSAVKNIYSDCFSKNTVMDKWSSLFGSVL